MTPKEKAEELYSKYYNRIEHSLSEDVSGFEKDIVKHCALIAVDEILNALPILRPAQDAVNYLENYSTIQTQLDNISYYWIDVKAEIQKL
jgi:hypothetical protein